MTMDRTGRLETQCEGRASLPAGSATPTKRAAGRGAVQLGPSGAAPAFCAPPRYPDPGTVNATKARSKDSTWCSTFG
jgi:hypothetical protein